MGKVSSGDFRTLNSVASLFVTFTNDMITFRNYKVRDHNPTEVLGALKYVSSRQRD